MKRQIDARWDISPIEAQQLQQELAASLVLADDFGELRHVAGVVIAHSRFTDLLTVAISVLQYPDMCLVEQRVLEYHTKFPFIPDLLSFREVPAVLAALEKLSFLPDLLVVDGPGVAHPKGLGVASHVGVVADLPTIGCSRSALAGSFVEPEINAGSQSSLVYRGEIIGTVFRSKNRVAPLFISAGHRISRDAAAALVREFCQGYRLPEPTRIANNLLSDARQAARDTVPVVG